MKTRIYFLLSLIPVLWVAVLALTYYADFNAVWFGVLRELLTIPILLGAIVLLVLSFIAWWKEKFAIRSFAFYAILLNVLAFTLLFTN